MSNPFGTLKVLYGSQTNNAQSIAEAIHIALSSKHHSELVTLNAAKKLPADVMIIVCSTTGNGDPPENAEAWWRSIKVRSMAKDSFKGVRYAVLGLGDTNYDKFCYMGKMIDKRLEELGGERLLPLYCADEATDMEEVVNKFTKDVIAMVDTLSAPSAAIPISVEPAHSVDKVDDKLASDNYSATVSSSIPQSETDGTPSSSVTTTETVTALFADMSLADAGVTEDPALSEETFERLLPDGVLSLADLAQQLGLALDLTVPTPAALIPANKPAVSKCVLTPPLNSDDVEHQSVAGKLADMSVGGVRNDWSFDHPYSARIRGARWLTSTSEEEGWADARLVMHMDIDLGSSGIVYTPGDAIAICCPNREPIVNTVLNRVRKAEGDNLSEAWTVDTGSGSCSVGDLLRYKLDLTGVPKKSAVFALAQHCTDPAERIAMERLCAKDATGKALWTAFVEQQGLGAGEVLALFPSCAPPLATLCSALSCMPPRLYSIASSPLVCSSIASVAFSLVRYELQVTATDGRLLTSIRRRGLCTSYLERAAAAFLSSTSAALIVQLRVFPKPSVDFHLPGSVSYPLILVGPGTGVAPFIGFLQHRQCLSLAREQDADDVCVGTWRGNFDLAACDLPSEHSRVNAFLLAIPEGSTWLFFGCRGERDHLYRAELADFKKKEVLTHLSVAMSRAQADKVYVTHHIRERGKELSKAMLGGAYVYVCGDGNHMAKDVSLALRDTLVMYAGMNEAQADAFIADMRASKRYMQDVWS